MKTILVLSTLSLFATSAFACSPPPMLMYQQGFLNQVVSSKAYNKALSEQMNRDFDVSIKSIKIEGDVVVSLSNGCVISLSSHYKEPSSMGMCPQFVKVTAKTKCK